MLVDDSLFATLDPAVRQGQDAVGPAVHADRHRRLRPAPAAPAGRRVPVHAGGGGRRRPDPARRGRLATPTRGRRSRPSARCSAEIGAGEVPELVVINKADAADPIELEGLQLAERAVGGGVGPYRGRDRRAAGRDRAAAAAARPRGHRRRSRTTGATWSPARTTRARCSPVRHGGGRHRADRPGPARPGRRARPVRRPPGSTDQPASADACGRCAQRMQLRWASWLARGQLFRA